MSILFNIKSTKKTYAIGLLVYPSDSHPKWNYLFGACMIARQLKKNDWITKNCDILILTPIINNQYVCELIKKLFDGHAIYDNSLSMKHNFEIIRRWNGVFNKLYFWDSRIFGYKRMLVMDTDIFIIDPSGYIPLFTNLDNDSVAGVYENNHVNNTNFDTSIFGASIPDNLTTYLYENDKSNYNMVAAGLLSFNPDYEIFERMVTDVKNGWDKTVERIPALKGKIAKSFYPEQEYLTGFFSGKWKNLPYNNYCGNIITKYHHGEFPSKYWDKLGDLPHEILGPCKLFFEIYPDAKILFNNIYQSFHTKPCNKIQLASHRNVTRGIFYIDNREKTFITRKKI